MSTDSPNPPRTRAEMRALRAAAEAEAAAADAASEGGADGGGGVAGADAADRGRSDGTAADAAQVGGADGRVAGAEAANRDPSDGTAADAAQVGVADGRVAGAEAANRDPSGAAVAGSTPEGIADGRLSAFDAAIRDTSRGYERVPEPEPAEKASQTAASSAAARHDATPPAETPDAPASADAADSAVPAGARDVLDDASATADPLGSAPGSSESAETAAPSMPRGSRARRESRDPSASHPAEPGDSAPRSTHRFGILLGSVLGILALVGATLGILSLTQGPRLVAEQIDPAQAIEVSGSRLILTTNQPLTSIDPEQVTVEPAVPFTVDAAGRSVGIRFTVPLDDETTYDVRVSDVTSTGGGPSTDLTTSFTTPPSDVFLLKRDAEGEDSIFRTDLTGEKAVAVYSADRIDDFRATTTQLVVAVEDEDGSSILVMNRDGSDPRALTLPGDGFVTGVQVSDRGGLVGYTYSDRELTDTSGRASVLVTQPLDGSGEPRIVEVADVEASIAEWEFVPDSAAVLFIDWQGALALEDLSSDAGTQALGTAMSIMGVSRGTYTAIIERTDGSVVELNLADGSEAPLPASEPDYGVATTIAPYPGGTLRHIVTRDENGLPIGQSVIRVDDEGVATPLIEVPSTDTILQVCASPSGQYTAVTIAPDLANNPYDDLLAPLPQTLHTHVLDTDTGEEIVPVTGFDISWCPVGPVF